MIKVNWIYAPEWATGAAIDDNGRGYWYENEPHKVKDKWGDPKDGKVEPIPPEHLIRNVERRPA